MSKEIKNIATVHKLKVRRVAVCESFIKNAATSSSHESYPLLHVPKWEKRAIQGQYLVEIID